MNLDTLLRTRYTCKKFNPNKKIAAQDFATIKNLLQMAASSTNLQPWHFVIADTEAGKARFMKATQGFYSFNNEKVANASHVVAFCAKINVDETHMQQVEAQEAQDGRFKDEAFAQQVRQTRRLFSDMHRYDWKDLQHWLEKQVYLNIGSFLLGVAALGIDATPIEGFDLKAFDQEFGLRDKGLTAVCLVALGYRADDDPNAALPKSRLQQKDIITVV